MLLTSTSTARHRPRPGSRHLPRRRRARRRHGNCRYQLAEPRHHPPRLISLQQPRRRVRLVLSPRLPLYVGADQLEGVAHAVDVAALVVVARVHAGADQAMANVVTGRKRGLDVRAVMRVHIDGVIEFKLARDVGQRGYQVVVVRTTRILGANRHHALGAAGRRPRSPCPR